MKPGVLCGFLLLFMMPAAAQTPSAEAPPDRSQDTPPAPAPLVIAPYELSGGYSLRLFTQSNYARIGLNGGYASFEYKVLSRISAAAEISAGFRNQGVNGDLSIYSAMVGPQIYPFRHRRKFTPFAHVLFGDGFYRIHYPAYAGFPAQVTTDSAFTWEGGGGLDLTHSARWAIRIVQLDYAQTKFLSSVTQANYRVSIGVVYRLSSR